MYEYPLNHMWVTLSSLCNTSNPICTSNHVWKNTTSPDVASQKEYIFILEILLKGPRTYDRARSIGTRLPGLLIPFLCTHVLLTTSLHFFFFFYFFLADAGTAPEAWSRQLKMKKGSLHWFITLVAQQLAKLHSECSYTLYTTGLPLKQTNNL
jgi:hypothetical protein